MDDEEAQFLLDDEDEKPTKVSWPCLFPVATVLFYF